MTLRDIAETSTLLALHRPLGTSDEEACRTGETFRDYVGFLIHLWRKELDRPDAVTSAASIAEEILITSLLLRCVTALQGDPEEISSMGPDSLSHRGSRPTGVQLCVELDQLFVECLANTIVVTEELRVQRLRRRAERWIDLLLGAIGGRDCSRLACDSQRYQEFRQQESIDAGWAPLFLLSLRHWCPDREITDEVRRGVFARLLSLSLDRFPPGNALRGNLLRGRLGRALPLSALRGPTRTAIQPTKPDAG